MNLEFLAVLTTQALLNFIQPSMIKIAFALYWTTLSIKISAHFCRKKVRILFLKLLNRFKNIRSDCLLYRADSVYTGIFKR